MDRTQEDDAYSEQEAEQRLQAALRGVKAVPPLKMKDIPRKRPYRARKTKESSKPAAGGR
jgi:hypothetical protein